MGWIEPLRTAERWLLTPECMACHAPITESGEPLVCATCRLRWRAIPDPVCAVCGEPIVLDLACRLCATWPGGVGPVRSAVHLDTAVRDLVHAFKYDGWWRLASAFADRMRPLLVGLRDIDLVPIPLAPGRRSRRGYNQAEALAAALGAVSGLPVRSDRLRRLRETPTQTRLTPDERAANLAGAFGSPAGWRPAMLVDDVFTTGATLVSAASALLEAGAPQVSAVTFARAAPPLLDAVHRLSVTTLLRSSEASG